MSEDWTGIATEVYTALSDVGVTSQGTAAQLVKSEKAAGGTEYAPAKQTTQYYDCAVVLSRWNRRSIDGSIIQETDKRALVDASLLAVPPKVGDKLRIGAEVLRIVPPVNVVGPAGVAVLYTLNLRGAEVFVEPDVASLDFSDADNSQYLTLLYP